MGKVSAASNASSKQQDKSKKKNVFKRSSKKNGDCRSNYWSVTSYRTTDILIE